MELPADFLSLGRGSVTLHIYAECLLVSGYEEEDLCCHQPDKQIKPTNIQLLLKIQGTNELRYFLDLKFPYTF